MSMTIVPSGEQRFILHGVSWEAYEQLRDANENRGIRMTYDEGELELMSPSKLHERYAELLARMLAVWTEEHQIPMQSCGTTTFKLPRKKGLEPDKGYYIQNEEVVRDRDQADLSIDPPPDLVIEVDVTSPLVEKLPIYAAMGVPEIWCWKNDALTVLELSSKRKYVPRDDSIALPGFPFDEVVDFIERRHTMDESALIRQFREWVCAHSE